MFMGSLFRTHIFSDDIASQLLKILIFRVYLLHLHQRAFGLVVIEEPINQVLVDGFKPHLRQCV